MPVFLVDLQGESFEMTPGETVLGRGETLRITNKKCSRRQALLVNQDDRVYLTPVGMNPVHLTRRGEVAVLPPNRKVQLENGDIINLIPGDLQFGLQIFNTDDSSSETGTVEMEDNEITAILNLSTEDNNQGQKRDRISAFGESPPRSVKKEKTSKESSPQKSNIQKTPPVTPPKTLIKRRPCKYGTACFRKNPLHFEQESHPGDPDFFYPGNDTEENSHSEENSEVSDYDSLFTKSPKKSPSKSSPVSPKKSPSKSSPVSPKKLTCRPPCQYGARCFRKNPVHFMEESHPGDADYSTPNTKEESDGENEEEQAQAEEENDEDNQTSLKKEEGGKQAPKTDKLQWTVVGNPKTLHVLDSPDIEASPKIAAFDMDGTLILTKSGKVHPTGREDWMWWAPDVKAKLVKLIETGYKIVIFTNQAGLEKGTGNSKTLPGKILDICKNLQYPIQVFMAGGKDVHRKPSPSMWSLLEQKYNKGVKIDLNASFYCGDAAGRAAGWKQGKSKDFSCSDRKFAANIGVKFYTPEEYFDKEAPAAFEWGGVSPRVILDHAEQKGVKAFQGREEDLVPEGKVEMVIMVGMAASGKSSFVKKYLIPKGYFWVNRDQLKTQEKCQKMAEQALKEGHSVVIDNTNPDRAIRQAYIKIAQKYSVPVRCFLVSTPRPLAEHLNMFRVVSSGGQVGLIPGIAYNVYQKKYEEPTLGEGFKEIKKINFCPQFKNEQEKKLFLQWLS
eukprot:TRINITY_DN4114_c0_g1_i1.p1 TRINITY_DN4114_c0_g1~~TRINITY_DN4114_c0_g1_i1.p1  ORF type:complete len:728 (+),score=176.83 TRINITY_DN4114_c0_g1_i1:2-2185(+)